MLSRITVFPLLMAMGLLFFRPSCSRSGLLLKKGFYFFWSSNWQNTYFYLKNPQKGTIIRKRGSYFSNPIDISNYHSSIYGPGAYIFQRPSKWQKFICYLFSSQKSPKVALIFWSSKGVTIRGSLLAGKRPITEEIWYLKICKINKISLKIGEEYWQIGHEIHPQRTSIFRGHKYLN